ncbi:MAG: hypothetical protein ACYDEJ_06990 [Desulfitobacteriaceae bacterium]
MRSKIDFYKQFFEQLSRRGFEVKRSDSSDYLADIYYKKQLIAFYTKADTLEKNPFVAVKDRVLNLINDTARTTAVRAGICSERPYTDANEKLPNGSYKLAEYNGVVLACKFHHLFDYVFSTYRLGPENDQAVQRQFFYNKEAATQDFAIRSGLVDEKALFSETELMVLHSNLVKLTLLDNNLANDDMISVGQMIDKIEDIVPELKGREYDFDFEGEFRQDMDAEIGG